MRNIKHLMEAAKKQDTTPRVSVILFGTALPAFQKSKADPNTVQALKDLLTREKDVTWIACQNTLDRNGLKVTDLLDGFSTVPSGIFEVARLEKQGFVYLRP